MTFDFGDAKFEIERDRALLVWIFNQFLYGEVTGIQVGHWLYRAPTLDAANFLARQAVEELQHVDRFTEILHMLNAEPGEAHAAVRFLSSGMMGDDWSEHVCLEMALGEGYVLTVLYALIDTIDDAGIRNILIRATRQEERHVAFGEVETRKIVSEKPGEGRRLLGLALWSLLAVGFLAEAVERKSMEQHAVLERFPAFLRHVRATTELRLQRLGILAGPLSEIGFVRKSSTMGLAAAGHAMRRVAPFGRARLTKTYLKDERLRPSAFERTAQKARG